MIISKDKLNDWLVALKKYALFAPTESNGVILYTKLNDPNEIVLERNSLRPPKEVLYPQTEKMFEFSSGKKREISTPELDGEKKIIFGIRPCDARSFSVLDHVFNGEYKDVYYLSKRKNTALIGLACTTPDINCFCTSLDGGPGSKDDVDILLTDIGDKYYVDVLTEKGKALVDENSSLFVPDGEGDSNKKQEAHTCAEAKVKRNVDVNGIPEKLGTMFESDFWKKISMKCLGCGVCTYLCPTCYCFDVQDEIQGGHGRRARIWDTCMSSEYTVHTSGHNPRPARMNRLRNRVYHKFKYYHDNFGVHLCVGCGRCVDECPVNVDIIDIVSEIGGEANE